MIRGFTVSTLVHASVLAMAMMSWPSPSSDCDRAIEKLRRENPGIRSIEIVMQLPECATSAELPIDFEDVGLVSNVSELRKSPDPKEEAVTPPEEEIEPPVAEPPEEEVAEPEEEVPLPQEKPEPKVPEKKPEPKKEPEKKKPDPLIKKDPPKKEPKKDDLDFLNDFDKALQDRRADRAKTPQEADDRPALGNADRDREGAGDKTGSTASLQAALKRQIGYCWRPSDDLPEADQIDVEIRLSLNADGSLDGNATAVSPRSRPVGRAGLVYDRAFLAVRKCAPYKLPPESYDEWKDIVVTIGRPTD
ncbi:MAG: cell envelope integrity protein TolA [Acidobacteria bacterium]|nr:cell envelope integrity protein TolA [Acidobacteriota bacterium]